MKKLLISIGIFVGTMWYISALGMPGWDNEFYYQEGWSTEAIAPSENVEIAQEITTDSVNDSESLLQIFLGMFKLSNAQWYPQGSNDTTIAYAKMIINMILGLVSFIALVFIIYAFYLLFFVQQEQWPAKAKKIFTGVGIAIAVMWLSRFIVSMIFYLQQHTVPGQ